MKGAKLWKRILFEGLHNDDDGIAELAIASPIILDPRPIRNIDTTALVQARGLSFPFETFFIESPISRDGGKYGVLVRAIRDNSGFFCEGAGIAGPKGYPVYKSAGFAFNADRNGNIISDTVEAFSPRRWKNVYDKQQEREVASIFLFLFCETAQFLACKNTGLAARQLPRKEARKARKRHGPAEHGYKYHVLVVRPPGAKHDAPAEEIGNTPRHVCRGHFKEYGPQFGKGKLFGKLEGRFYIPPHMKGQAGNGRVYKDYSV